MTVEDRSIYSGPIRRGLNSAASGVKALTERVLVLETKMATTPWVNVTAFLNGWANYGSNYQVARYRKVGDRVELEGLIRSGTINAAAFNLPVGFRPPMNLVASTMAGEPPTGVRIDIQFNGNVWPLTGPTGYLSLTNINFATS